MRKIIASIVALLTMGVVVPLGFITHAYIVRPRQVENFGDWFSILFPLLPATITLCLCALLWRLHKGMIARGIVWGALIASTLYLVHQAFILRGNYDLIKADGTAHWGLLELPVVWIALPAVLIGISIGAFFGWITMKIRAQQAGPGYPPQGVGSPDP